MLDLWYKNAVLYCIDVETYMDANGDGVGDFEGLTQRLDYIAGVRNYLHLAIAVLPDSLTRQRV
jgi:hypothetical protein